MSEFRPNICRMCTAFCPVLVEVENERPVSVKGDPSNSVYKGYTCPKGRALAEMHNSPNRLLHSLKRTEDGELNAIGIEQAMDEIADKISAIAAKYGPRSVAIYIGTGSLPYPVTMPTAQSWLRQLGSPMFFTPGTIDQPGKSTAVALHGGWEAGEQGFDGADTFMLIGTNPVISKCHGYLGQNPGAKLKESAANGMQLIVIDPRFSETARRATLHLPVRPGEDPTLLAGIIRIILQENLYDAKFVSENAEGLAELKLAVEEFTLDYVSARTGVNAADIEKAAHIFAKAKRGGAMAGTGPNFSTRGDVTEYLVLCLNTLCGRWVHAGEKLPKPNVLLPAYTARAQPIPPYPAANIGEKLRVRNLAGCAAGLPTAALAEEILLEGEGQIKALINIGGNPMMSWPDQRKTQAALHALELHVSLDIELTATAALADYVIAPLQSFEAPGVSQTAEGIKYYGYGMGLPVPWAQYAPRIVQPPAGSDLIEEWQFFHGLAKRMGYTLKLRSAFNAGSFTEGAPIFITLDNDNPPTTEEIIEQTIQTSRVPLDDVKKHPNGKLYDEIEVIVAPRDPECTTLLQIGAPYIMDAIKTIRKEDYESLREPEFPLLLVSRRVNNILNSIGRTITKLTNGKNYNPLYVHPNDLTTLGLASGDSVAIRSEHDTVPAVVEADDTLKPGVVAMAQNYGGNPDQDDQYLELGTNTNRLIAVDKHYDPISGIPRMGAIPVAVTAM